MLKWIVAGELPVAGCALAWAASYSLRGVEDHQRTPPRCIPSLCFRLCLLAARPGAAAQLRRGLLAPHQQPPAEQLCTLHSPHTRAVLSPRLWSASLTCRPVLELQRFPKRKLRRFARTPLSQLCRSTGTAPVLVLSPDADLAIASTGRRRVPSTNGSTPRADIFAALNLQTPARPRTLRYVTTAFLPRASL